MNEWQPIESAPRDRYPVLVLSCWDYGNPCPPGTGWCFTHCVATLENDVWRDQHGYEVEPPPEWWMALPSPPTETPRSMQRLRELAGKGNRK